MLDAAAEMPDRKFTFIHRQHMAASNKISERFKPLIDNKNIEFIFSFKYAKAHVMSATEQPYHTEFHDVNCFIDVKPHQLSGFQYIPDYRKMTVAGESTDLKTQLEVDQMLHKSADKALSLLTELDSGNNRELALTLHDIRTMALLGKYYAHKIAGATHLAMYRETKDKLDQDKSLAELEDALNYWKQYTETALKEHINPIWTNRAGHVDWIKSIKFAEMDIEIAKR